MADFAYKVIDTAGRERQGRIRAASDSQARAALIRKSFHIVTVEPAPPRKALLTARTARLSPKQLTLFTRQMSSLMTVSPLEEALRTISRQTESANAQAVLGKVHGGVMEGQSLAESLAREPRSFPPLYRAMISAGESSGSLPIITERLAELLERQAQVRGKIISALAYPIILTLVAFGVVAGLMISVVPRVVEQFDSASAQLPLITRIVIAISDFLSGWWWALLIVFVLAAIGFWQAMRVPAFKYRFDAMLLKLPLIGRLIRDMNAARLARTLATMVQSRLPLLEGLKLTTRTVRNAVLREALEEAVVAIRSGGSLSAALRNAGTFPPLLVYLAASGESAGQLDIMLERAAEYLEREFENFTSTAMSLLEPAIIVVMGGVVALIILSILLPILQLQNLTGL
ncbi:type II secretion system inner membrane protein GspF [Blastomonas sp.]|uniref:type II secretion system inner membrane protein GspF n=1 Tax=Blastomonas sp. TaxID=1909299 RepID=UPI0035935E7A